MRYADALRGYVTAQYVDALRSVMLGCYRSVLRQCVTAVRCSGTLRWCDTQIRYYVCACARAYVCVHVTDALARHTLTFAWRRHTGK